MMASSANFITVVVVVWFAGLVVANGVAVNDELQQACEPLLINKASAQNTEACTDALLSNPLWQELNTLPKVGIVFRSVNFLPKYWLDMEESRKPEQLENIMREGCSDIPTKEARAYENHELDSSERDEYVKDVCRTINEPISSIQPYVSAIQKSSADENAIFDVAAARNEHFYRLLVVSRFCDLFTTCDQVKLTQWD